MLESTRGRRLDPARLHGKTFVVFYEAHGHTEDNAALKEAVAELSLGPLAGRLEVLGVARVAGLRFVAGIVHRAVRAVAERHGVELYLDFEGALLEAPFQLSGQGAAVAIVDEAGAVVHRALGRLGPGDVDRFFEALRGALPAHLGARLPACP